MAQETKFRTADSSPLTFGRLVRAGARLVRGLSPPPAALTDAPGFSPHRFFFFRAANWWSAGHLLAEAGSHISVSGETQVERLKLRNFDNLALWCRANAMVSLRAGGDVVLHFLAGPNAGGVEVIANGKRRTISLERETTNVVDVRIEADQGGELELRIRPHLPSPNQHRRIALLGVEFAREQRWVLRSQRVGPLCQLTRGTHGAFLSLVTDDTIGAAIGAAGEWAPHDVEVFRRHIRPGNAVLDVGANIGHHTVVFSKLVGDGGRVLAIEPQTMMFNLLCGNLAINDCQNTEALRIAVGNRPHVARLYPISYTDSVNFGAIGVSLDDELRGEPVECRTLDDVVTGVLKPITRVDFVKMDVQAYEYFALLGFQKTLTRDAPKLFLEISPEWMKKAGYDYNDVYNLLRSYGYQILDPYTDVDMTTDPRQWSGAAGEEWDVLATRM